MREAGAAGGGAAGGSSDVGQIILQQPGQEPVALTNQQVVEIIQQQQREGQALQNQVKHMSEEIERLQIELNRERDERDREIKVVEVIHDKHVVEPPAPTSPPSVTANSNDSVETYPPNLLKRYEALLEENREMRRQLDELRADKEPVMM
jgi:hypothetical protein